MKPIGFDYLRATSVKSAIGFLQKYEDASIIAGGQSLLPMMNMRAASPSHVIDISRIKDLGKIQKEDDEIVIGALARHADLENNDLIKRHLPLFRDAASELAHPAIRNKGTLGGSLALADPAAELPACAIAMGATIEVTGPLNRRFIKADEFFKGAYATALLNEELITTIRCPIRTEGVKTSYEKLARRHGDYGLVGLAAQASVQDGILFSPRFA